MSEAVLRAIATHSERLPPICHSAETGSGKTTLLFSHLSQHHEVFAIDDGGSISRVQSSSLFNPERVTFIQGPSQMTLPRHRFAGKLEMALIDGPHAYPFPDLEYYYFYPQICERGLLLIDDINIPSIGSMFEIVKAGEMFDLVDVVENTAFFLRTTARLIDPLGDDWWLQGFNRSHYEYAIARDRSSSRTRQLTRFIPSRVKDLVPRRWKTRLLNRFNRV
jgi:hypothetical protein